MLFKIAEQVLTRKDSQQNGTCATAFKLFAASPDDMKTSDLVESFVNAPPLSVDDILLSDEENVALTERLTHTVLRTIITFGGERFSRFRKDVDACLPCTPDKIPVHKTEILPLPAMNIDESSTSGNAEVLTAMFKELKLDINSPDFTQTVKLTAGDQLSIARIRSLVTNRAGHDSFGQSFLWALCMPGLFHYKMAATHGLLELHFGSDSTGDPGSLAFHNSRLLRKPITLTSPPPFRTCRDIIFVSLYARVLHCLELVSKCESLDDYAATVDFADLKRHAGDIVNQYANAQVAHKLRREGDAAQRQYERDIDLEEYESGREPQAKKAKAGDKVLEKAMLFLRDALILREFTDAIKSGDSGRVLTVLKMWALAFRGSGRTKYAHETLHLIHNITHVWPAPLRYVNSRVYRAMSTHLMPTLARSSCRIGLSTQVARQTHGSRST